MNAPTPPLLRSTRLIPVAMALGVLALTGVAVVVRLNGTAPGDPGVARLLSLIVVGLALGFVPTYLLLRRTFLARVQAQRSEALALLGQERMPPPLLTLMILGAALAEGVGLFGAVTVLVGGHWAVLAAPALAVALILAQLPTRVRLEALVRG